MSIKFEQVIEAILNDLQLAHDLADNPERAKAKLREVELVYGFDKHPALTWSPPK